MDILMMTDQINCSEIEIAYVAPGEPVDLLDLLQKVRKYFPRAGVRRVHSASGELYICHSGEQLVAVIERVQ